MLICSMQHINRWEYMDKYKHFGPLINMISRGIVQRLDRQAAQLDLTSTQLFILHYICERGNEGICQRDIEQEFELTHATVSGIVSRLESKGFLRCESSEKDKRFKSITATAKAAECDEEMHRHILEAEKELMKGFSDSEKEQLLSFLMRMIDNFEIELPHHRGKRKEQL